LNIAGVCNERRNVAGLMPHPERASEEILGSDDGKWIFESIISAVSETGGKGRRDGNENPGNHPAD